jgi:hypothetical protein
MLGFLIRMRSSSHRSNEYMQTGERCPPVCELIQAPPDLLAGSQKTASNVADILIVELN